MLNRVKIQNFKSIGEPGVDLELKPLTFLVGPNGGGKSSILEAIGVAAQGGPSGQSANVPTWESMKHKPGESDPNVEVYFANDKNLDLGYRFRVEIRGGGGLKLETAHVPRQDGMIDRLTSGEFRPKTFLISSTRGNVPYSVNVGPNPQWVGMHGQDLLLLLSKIFGSREHDKIADKIAVWTRRFGIDDLRAALWEGNAVGADYIDSELKVALNLALSSSGSKQILTVITQLFWSPQGSLIMIEEPEISLHPQAQIDVIEMFAEAIKEDKQILATTHSLMMMQGIGYAVIKGWLMPDQIAIYHIEKKKEAGTVAKRLHLSEKGAIKGWIPSFTQVERRLLREWAKTLPEE